MHPCDYGHEFYAVWDHGTVSHYFCGVCKREISEEDYINAFVLRENEEEDDVDVVDDDDMC